MLYLDRDGWILLSLCAYDIGSTFTQSAGKPLKVSVGERLPKESTLTTAEQKFLGALPPVTALKKWLQHLRFLTAAPEVLQENYVRQVNA